MMGCDRSRRRPGRRPRAVVWAALVLALACGSWAVAADAWQTISAPSPYRACGERPPGMFANAEVEPSIAVSPSDPKTLVAVFQQDRFSRGAARGLVAGISRDGGGTWSNVELPFSLCATTPNTGWAFASD